MGLPKNYFELIGLEEDNNNNQRRIISPFDVDSASKKYHKPIQEDADSLWDFLEYGAKGAASGITWGLSESVLEADPWEKMSGMQRAGWVLGEGGSYFLPYIGPFGAVGAGLRAVPKMAKANKFIASSADDALQALNKLDPSDVLNLNKQIQNTAKLTNQSVRTVRKKIYSEVSEQINSKATNNIGMRWIRDLDEQGQHAIDAAKNISTTATHAVRVAFKKNGVDIKLSDAQKIGERFAEGVKKGDYVEDVAEWVSRGLQSQEKWKFAARENVANYLGMATQDLLLMGIHGLGSNAIKSQIKEDHPFEPGNVLWHSVGMALTFPLLRAIPGGGSANLRMGYEAYKTKYLKTNYREIAKEHGDGTLRSLLKMMVSGTKKDLLNFNKLGQTTFKVSGQYGKSTYNGASDILSKLDDMPQEHVIQLLEKIKRVADRELRGKFAGKYFEDFKGSLGRIALGTVVTNPWIFKSGAFSDMESSELGAHIFMSALMVKSRGAWGKTQQRSFQADLTPYYDTLNLLGVDATSIKETIKFRESLSPIEGHGYSIHTNKVGKQIVEVIDNVISSTTKKSISFSDYEPGNKDHILAKKLSRQYNIMKKFLDPKADILKVENLDAKTLNRIARDLKALKFDDGMSIGELGAASTTTRLTSEPAEKAIGLYQDMLYELGNLGYTINVDKSGKVKYSIIEGKDGESIGNAMLVNEMLNGMTSIGKGDPMSKVQLIQEAVKRSKFENKDEFLAETDNIIQRYMDRIASEFENNFIVREPIRENPLWDFIVRSKHVEASDRMYNIIAGNKGNRESDNNLILGLDKLFQLSDGKYADTIYDYGKLFRGYDPNATTKETAKEHDLILRYLEELKPLFDLRKHASSGDHKSGKSSKGVNELGKNNSLELSSLKAAADNFKDVRKDLPPRLKGDFTNEIKNIFLDRLFDTNVTDPRAIGVTYKLIEEGIAQRGDDGKLHMPSPEAMRAEILDRISNGESYTNKDADQVYRAGKTIREVLGEGFTVYDNISYTESGTNKYQEISIDSYVKISKELGNKVISDFFLNAKTALEKVRSNVDNGTRLHLKELNAKITNLITKLDPDRNVEGPKNVLETVKNLQKEIDVVASRFSESSKNELKTISHYLEKLLTDNIIDANTNKFKVKIKDIVGELDPSIEGDRYLINDRIIKPVNQIISELYLKEQIGTSQLNNIVIKIQNLIASPPRGMAKEQVQKIIQDLTRQWYKDFTGLTNPKEAISFPELVDIVNKEGSFGDVIKIVRNMEEVINKNVTIANEHSVYNTSATRAMESLENGFSIKEHHKSVNEILNNYDILKKDGTLDPNFVADIAADPNMAFQTHVRDRIYANPDKGTKAMDKEWSEFQHKHAMPIVAAMANATTINRVQLAGVSGGGNASHAKFSYGNPSTSTPSNEYLLKTRTGSNQVSQKYDLFFIDDTISFRSRTGLLRNTSIDALSNPVEVQKALNESLKTTDKTDLYKMLSESNGRLSPDALKKIMDVPEDYLFYVRLSPKDKLLFVGTEQNLNIVDKEFKEWYDITADRYMVRNDDVSLKTFERIFENLLDKPTNSQEALTLKLMLPYITNLGRRGEFDNFIKTYRSGDAEALAKIQTNLFKRGFLTDGGTTQRLNTKVYDWASKYHPQKRIRTIANKYLKNGEYKVLPIKDENGLPGGMLSIRAIAEQVNMEIMTNKNTTDVMRRIVTNNHFDITSKDPLKELKSLESSLIDGAKFVSKDLMDMVMASRGMYMDAFTVHDSPNGAKTIIYGVGDGNQLAGKGYMIYHPDVKMPKDIDIILGESAAKTLDAVSFSQTRLTNETSFDPFVDVTNRKTDNFSSSLKNATQQHYMSLPLDALGVSFTSKNTKGVNIAGSIFDFQSTNTIKKATEWMNFKGALTEISNLWMGFERDGGQSARYLFNLLNEGGNPLDRGHGGMQKLLFSAGAMPDNPWVNPALRKMIRNMNYDTISKRPSINGGEDNFIVPNVNGDLTMPIHGYLKGVGGAGGIGENRLSLTYGGIGLNSNTMSRPLGKGGTDVSNLQGEHFIYRNNHGMDVVMSIKGKNIKHWNQLEDFVSTIDPKKIKGDMSLKGMDNNYVSNDVPVVRGKDFKLGTDFAVQKTMEGVIREIEGFTQKYDLNLKDAFKLLRDGKILVEEIGTKNIRQIKLTDYDKVREYNLQLGSISHAVPVLGYDKVAMRIEKILTGMNGLVEVNSWDLRTIMQRDNDGDHLYTHTKMKSELFEAFAKENGRIDDFRMFKTSDVLNKDYVNIFGIGENGRAGELQSDVGFHSYSSILTEAQKSIGSIIGARNTLSWLSKLKFGVGDKNNPDQFNYLLNDYSAKSLLEKGTKSQSWKSLVKYFDVMQNSVDIHGGIHRLLRDKTALQDWIFFGKSPDWLKEASKDDPILLKHLDNARDGFINSNFTYNTKGVKHKFGDKLIDREIFHELLRTLKGVNSISNEVWDAAGSRRPDPDEIKTSFYAIKSLFTNPTKYLSDKIVERIGLLKSRNDGNADLLIAQYMKLFYGDTTDYKSIDKRGEFYNEIIKGKHYRKLEEVFAFKGLTDPIKGFESSINGTMVKELISNKNFFEKNFENIGNNKLSVNELSEAGVFIKNIESFVHYNRMFGDDAVTTYSAFQGDFNIKDFGTNKDITNKSHVQEALNNGILRNLANREYKKVLASIKFLSNDSYPNANKLDKLKNRLTDLSKVIEILDIQSSKDMLINKTNVQVITPSKEGSFKYSKNLQKGFGDKQVAVYRIRGEGVKLKEGDKDIRLYDYGIEGKNIDHSQLEFVGYFDKNGHIGKKNKPLILDKNFTYIVDRKPLQKVNMATKDMEYSDALFKATYGDVYTPEMFIKNGSISDFKSDVNKLRNEISFDYINTIKSAIHQRVLSGDIYALSRTSEEYKLNEFIKKWSNKVDSESGLEPIEILSRHLLQPKIVQGKWRSYAGNDMPVYKTNNHLRESVFSFLEKKEMFYVVEKLTKDVEDYVSGRANGPDISSYDRANYDKFDYGALGKMADIGQSLAKTLDIEFTSPILTFLLQGRSKRYKGPVEYINNNGKKIAVKKQSRDIITILENAENGRIC